MVVSYGNEKQNNDEKDVLNIHSHIFQFRMLFRDYFFSFSAVC